MFGNTGLPLSPGFATAAGFQQTEFDFSDGSGLFVDEFPDTPLEERTPFTLTMIPEPTTGALFLMGALVVCVRRLR